MIHYHPAENKENISFTTKLKRKALGVCRRPCHAEVFRRGDSCQTRSSSSPLQALPCPAARETRPRAERAQEGLEECVWEEDKARGQGVLSLPVAAVCFLPTGAVNT